jgi:pilus assembly protein Flp/PilA
MGFIMRNFLKSYLADEAGAAAAEYALILTLIGGVLLAAVSTLGTDIATALTNAGAVIAAYKFS